jgi:hypothetical protein
VSPVTSKAAPKEKSKVLTKQSHEQPAAFGTGSTVHVGSSVTLPTSEVVQRLLDAGFGRANVIRALRDGQGDEELALRLLKGESRSDGGEDDRPPRAPSPGLAMSGDEGVGLTVVTVVDDRTKRKTGSMTDALLGAPVGSEDVEAAAGEGSQGSGSEQSEAEGEFKGGKGDFLTSRSPVSTLSLLAQLMRPVDGAFLVVILLCS